MRNTIYILLALVAILIGYILFTPAKVEIQGPDTRVIDSLEFANKILTGQTIELKDSIESLKLKLITAQAEEIIIYETFIDSINSVEYLDDGEQIKLFTELISEEVSSGK